MNNYRQITFRHLKQNKKRTILTIIGIVLAVSLFSAIGTFIFSFQHNMVDMQKNRYGSYEVSYNGLNEKEINSLKNNFKILNYGITQNGEPVQCLDSEKNTLLDITLGDGDFYKDIKTFDLIEGSIPKDSNEILLERKAIRRLNKKLGDSIKVKVGEEEKIYKISGFYKPNTEVYDEKYHAYGFFNSKDLNSKQNYSIFVNLKDKKDIWKSGREIGENLNLSKEQIKFNEQLLNAMMQSKNAILNNNLGQIALIVIAIIILSTVAVIYNSFNISVTERIKQFGILRSIGASPSKIRAMVFMEGIIMYLVSVPIGILLGYGGLWVVIKILSYYESSNLRLEDVDILKINFYPEIILICSVLAFITVLLAIITPMVTASKISPIDAIRDSAKFRKEKIKRRKARLIKLLFGIEGQVAYKNIRRNNKRFLVTVLSLSVSFIMFVTITSIIIAQKGMVDNFDQGEPYEAILISNTHKKGISENTIKDIKDSNLVNDIYTFKNIDYPTLIEKKYVNNKFLDDYNKINNSHVNEIKVGKDTYVESLNGKIEGFNETSLKALEEYVVDGKIDMKALKEGGVIVFDTNRVHIGDKIVVNRFTNYKVGDTVKIPKLSKHYTKEDELRVGGDWGEAIDKAKEYLENGEYINAKVIAVVNKNPFDYISGAVDDIDFIFDDGYFEKEFLKAPLFRIGLGLKEDNENTNKFFDNIAEDNNLMYINFQKNKQEQESIMTIMYTFIYGFIIIVSLIAVVNIINTITMGLLLRKKEFATLSAIGMTKRQLSKMVILEGVIYGIIVSIVGSIVSYGTFIWAQNIIKKSMELTHSTLSITLVFIIGIVGIIILTLIASLIPLRKFKKMNIIESIKEEE